MKGISVLNYRHYIRNKHRKGAEFETFIKKTPNITLTIPKF